jgi:DNA-binding response OmpR family regulator
MRGKILIVDDDPKICDLLTDILVEAGFRPVTAQNTEEAWEKVVSENPNLILLDIEVPLKGGLQLCNEIKQNETFRRIPIIFLTVRAKDVDKISALNLGGDDFITKPFNQKELIARINVAFRRSETLAAGSNIIRSTAFMVDFDKRIIMVNQKEVKLTPKEFDLLKLLYVNRHRVLSDREIFQQIWGVHCNSMRSTVYTHINRLRKKLKSHADKIQTIPGTGFRFDERKR